MVIFTFKTPPSFFGVMSSPSMMCCPPPVCSSAVMVMSQDLPLTLKHNLNSMTDGGYERVTLVQQAAQQAFPQTSFKAVCADATYCCLKWTYTMQLRDKLRKSCNNHASIRLKIASTARSLAVWQLTNACKSRELSRDSTAVSSVTSEPWRRYSLLQHLPERRCLKREQVLWKVNSITLKNNNNSFIYSGILK